MRLRCRRCKRQLRARAACLARYHDRPRALRISLLDGKLLEAVELLAPLGIASLHAGGLRRGALLGDSALELVLDLVANRTQRRGVLLDVEAHLVVRVAALVHEHTRVLALIDACAAAKRLLAQVALRVARCKRSSQLLDVLFVGSMYIGCSSRGR